MQTRGAWHLFYTLFLPSLLDYVCCVFKQAFCLYFIDMYHFRGAPSSSHSYIPKFSVAVARVSCVSVLQMWLWLEFWACQIRQHRFEITIVPFLKFVEYRKSDMFIKHIQKSLLCFQAIVLYVLYRHVLFSMCPRHKPSQHFEVWSGCGCSPVGVGFQNVPVARILGMSD